MKSILGAIIKLLYNTLMEGMQKTYLTEEITVLLGDISTTIEKNDYPTELLQEFEHLKKAKNRNQFTTDKDYYICIYGLFLRYYEYGAIRLEKYQLVEDDIFDASKKVGDYNIIDMNKIEFQDYLLNFLKTIKHNLSEFICFNRYFLYFENEFNKKYLSNNRFKLLDKNEILLNKIKNDNEEESNDDVGNYDECFFVIDM